MQWGLEKGGNLSGETTVCKVEPIDQKQKVAIRRVPHGNAKEARLQMC